MRARRVTSRELLRLEMALICLARDNAQNWKPLNCRYQPRPMLSEEQRKAVCGLLGSSGLVTVFRGGAGTGKSRTLCEVAYGLEQGSYRVVTLAPQRQQVIDMRADGLPAQTLAGFLTSPTLDANTVVIVDEAGQVGIRDMYRLLALARTKSARVILSGDTRQHGAVAASDALIALEKFGGLPRVEIREIRRQDPSLAKTVAERAAVTTYRRAVALASRGQATRAFDLLDRMGWVRQLAPEEARRALAQDYVECVQKGEKTLALAQTWNEVHAVNEAIRHALEAAGKLTNPLLLNTFKTIDLTDAEKRLTGTYPEETSVFFTKRYGRYRKGDIYPVVGATAKGITLMKDGRQSTVAYRHTNRINVIRERQMAVAVGERLQIKASGRSVEGIAFANGELVTVRNIRDDGDLVVEDGRGATKTLRPNQRIFNYGYAVTSYGSQGKTVNTLLFADSGCRAATNQKQWYVTASRARIRVAVFTSDKVALRAAIAAEGRKKLALDAVHEGTRGQNLEIVRAREELRRLSIQAALKFTKQSRSQRQQVPRVGQPLGSRTATASATQSIRQLW